MAVAWTPQSHAGEWALWQNRETITYRSQTAVGVYSAFSLSLTHPVAGTPTTAVAKRRVPTFKEQAASASVYVGQTLTWLVPAAAFTAAGVVPKVGDQLRDASGIDHTILRRWDGKFGLTAHFETLALALVAGLRSLGTLLRPAATANTEGKRVPNLGALYSDVPCRVQRTAGTRAGDEFESPAIAVGATAYLGQQIIAQFGDVFEVGSERYKVVGWADPERLDALMTLDLEQVG